MNKEKTIGILVARMTSSRLPGKALRLVNGKPLLFYPLERLKAVEGIDEIWLATTQHPSDEPLMLWGIQEEIQVFGYPGETDDVVGRISALLDKAKADRFIMVLGDTPFPETRLMQKFLDALDAHPEWEGVCLDRSDKPCVHSGVSCYRTSGWKKIDAASQELKYREHLGSILRSQPDLICRGVVTDDPEYYAGPYRLSVDTQADLNLVETLAKALQKPGEVFSLKDVIAYLQAHPELAAINQHVRQKTLDEEPIHILFAVQAGGDYGTGHLARCKTLARIMEEHFSAGITFWMDTPQGTSRRELLGEGYRLIEGSWSLQETVRQGNYNRLVLDFQTSVTPSLIQGIRLSQPDLPLIVLDNSGLGALDADAVIFPNAHAQIPPEFAETQTNLYQGSQYIVLGDGFWFDQARPEPEASGEKPVVLITMGGRDPEMMTEKVLDALKDLKDTHIHLVVPPLYPFPENLEKIATRLPSTITIHWQTRHLKPLMQRATLAVAAFGITAYELAFMGVPTILLGHYQANEPDMERFCQWGAAINLGWIGNVAPNVIYNQVCELLGDENRRKAMQEKGKALVNKQGPLRVAEAIMATTRKPVSVTTKD